MRSETVKVVEEAVAILEQLAQHPGGVSITDLSEYTGLGKSTVHRLLMALQNHGLVQQELDTHRYSLGYRIVELSASLLTHSGLVTISMPLMKRIVGVIGETVSLHVVRGDRRLCVAEVESPLELKFSYGVGRSTPLHLGASGKIVLAYLSPSQREETIDRLTQDPRVAEGEPGSAELRESLEEIRRHGYAESFGEVVQGVRSIGVPLFDRSGQVIGSLGIVGPAFRFNDDRRAEAVALLKQAAAHISAELGFGDCQDDALIGDVTPSSTLPS
ncbi:MAG: IclR family transcriptional regulator [Chloroflexota bacterium]|nr:MAG: IclR family transcriptional regulator [Chloroflexota bacterium]